VNAQLRRAHPHEAEKLTELALLSKRSWGYSDDFMHRVAEDMLVTQSDIAGGYCIVAEIDGAIAAYLLVRMDGKEAFLRDLFVHPEYFRRGLGRTLFEEALQYARERGARRLTLDADPNAEAFYERLGMVRVGAVASSAGNGRMLPVMAYKIS
jgi:GNAT superfamily N-acetyltransferase